MATAVIMPKQGQSVESCVITSWEKHVGDEVHAGECLFTYETDKASFEEEAKADGTLLAVFFQEQDDVPCMTQVAVIGTPGEDISGFGPGSAGAPAEPQQSQAPAAPAAAAQAPAPQAAQSRETASGVSPRARAAAERLYVPLENVTPTGPHGRVLERDVLCASRTTAAAFRSGAAGQAEGTGLGGRITLEDLSHPHAAAAPQAGPGDAEAAYHDEKLSRVRKHIAASMHDSLANSAQLTHHASFDASGIVAYRRQLKDAQLELPNITYNDIVLYAVSRVLRRHPVLNANWIDDETIRYFHHVHLGMAVDTPRGLLVPTIFDADTKSLAQISKEAKALAEMAQSGSISPDLLSGATFTVSNLGTLDIEMFTPVINPPQTAILGVDCMVDRVRMRDGQITVYPAMGLSLTYDHRAMDGAPASRFLKELKTSLEQFTALLAE